MNVSLTPQLESFVDQLVKSGRYQSNSEVMRAALRLLLEQRQAHQAQVEALRRDLSLGIASLDRGEGIPADEVFAELQKKTYSNTPAKLKTVARGKTISRKGVSR